MEIKKLALEELEDCACGVVEFDFSEPEGCTDECGDCGEGAGIEECIIAVCLTDLLSEVCVDCIDSVNAGVVSPFSIMITPGSAMTFNILEDSGQVTSNEAVDDDGSCSITETFDWQSKTGNRELCWLREHKNKEVVMFKVDNCGRVRQYGGNGGFKLRNWTEDTGRVKGDFKGITGQFINSGCDAFKFVGNFTADAAEIMNAILAQ